MTRLTPAVALDDFSGPPRRRRSRRDASPRRDAAERRLAWLRRQEAELRAEREQLEGRLAPPAREPVLEPLTGAVPVAHDPWGPAVRMGRTLRVQAAVGHRAAVIELKPGLFLVAEVPEAALRPEFGFVPMLAPMIMKAAAGTIGPIVQAVQAGKERRQQAHAPPAAPPAQPAPLALPGPVASPATAGLGWADDALVGEVIGCDACGGRCGR